MKETRKASSILKVGLVLVWKAATIEVEELNPARIQIFDMLILAVRSV